MKSILLAFSSTLIILASCSKSGTDDNPAGGSANIISSSSVPAATVAAFTTEFSGATAVEWQRNSSSSFTVQFNHSSQRHDAGYDDNGHRSSHSIICIDGTVPEIVLQAFRQRFPTDNVYEWKLRTDGTWKAHFMRGSVKYEATYTASGDLVKFERA
ncbi:MAG TPA: hypothetical protein VMZ03_06880 [Chitinophagaceae bacterium]|nr:hypothetical protein [Chitinophagaceae bacterium]